MPEVKLIDIINSKPALEKIASSPLPIKISYRISKLLNKINKEFKLFEETRIGLIRKLGEEKDGNVEVTPENQDVFLKEMTSLLNEPVNFPAFQFSIEDFPDSIQLTPAESGLLEVFFEPEEKESEKGLLEETEGE